MSINPLYIPLFNIEEVILNKDTGLPLSGGIVTFFEDEQRLNPKSVFKITGISPDYTFLDVGAVFTLGISGTFVDASGNPFVPYAYPYNALGVLGLYYVTVKSAGLVEQFTREAVPYVGAGGVSPSERSNTANELSNPQFVEISFPGASMTISVTGSNTVTPIAPSWDLITSGTGDVVLQRLEPTAAGIPTNPPYALSISAGASLGATVTLRQRLLNSPALMRSEFASGTLAAAVLSGGSANISMTYIPSTGTTTTTIIANTAISTDGAYHVISGNAAVADNISDPASTGYVDINVLIPTSRVIAITSIQVVGVSYSVNLVFDEQSANRQKDQLFHYYENSLVKQPKSNILAGWNFGLNPWQFRNPAVSNVANNTYTADQTIIIQQAFVDSATGNNVSVQQGSLTQNYGFLVKSVTATNKFCMLQYVAPQTARPYWGKKVSVMVKASSIITAPNVTTPQFKVRLVYRAGLPATPMTQTVPVSAWDNANNSIPTLAGWTYINATNDPLYTLTVTEDYYSFNGFQLPASTNADMTLGVMIIMMNNLDSTNTPDQILFDSVSLVHNDFAIEAEPETEDQSIAKCQFYFEHSYDVFQPASGTGVVTNVGVRFSKNDYIENGGNTSVKRRAFGSDFMQVKNKVPTMHLYGSNATTSDRVSILLRDSNGNTVITRSDIAVSTGYAVLSASKTNFYYLPKLAAEVSSSGANFQQYYVQTEFHYEADARLGV